MEVYLQLFSIYREKLPPSTKGRATLQLEEGATLKDILSELEITRKVVISVNGNQVTDKTYQLQDKDEVKIFSSTSGG